MAGKFEIGVFLPSVSRAWFHSQNTPYLPGSFAHTVHVAQGAELYGYDFVLSPQNWRGSHGTSGYWRNTVDSIALTGALLQATSRIQVWGTAHCTVFPPAVVASIWSSFAEIGPGRVGLNIVTGGHMSSLDSLGIWDDELQHDERYDMADEWIEVIKRLWTEEGFDHEGRYFKLWDALMAPKPTQRPTLVNAGASPRGFEFAVENCDVAFMMCGDDPRFIESAKKSKEVAREKGKEDFKTFGLFTLVPGETDDEACALRDWIESGVDTEGLVDIAEGYKMNKKGLNKLSSSSLAPLGGDEYHSFLPGMMAGSYEALAERIGKVVTEAEIDGMMLVVPDYNEHLQKLALRTFPKLKDFGLDVAVGADL